MDFFNSILKAVLSPFNKEPIKQIGPNTLEELLLQFDLPPKQKTKEEIINSYLIKETLAGLEVEYLRSSPVSLFKGAQRWKDGEGNIFFDWVPCSVRPEVVYCSYGKN